MKKIFTTMLLSCAAVFAASAQSPVQIVDQKATFAGYTEFPNYVMDHTPEMADGILKSYSPAEDGSWRQFLTVTNCKFEVGKEYTITYHMRGTGNGTIDVVMGDWGNGNTVKASLPYTSEWADCTVKMPPVPVASGFVNTQLWSPAGTGIEIAWVTISHEGYLKTVKTAYTNPEDYKFLGYDSKFWTRESTTFDGKPCFHATCTDGVQNQWDRQAVVECDLEYGTRYYIDFDVNSEVAVPNFWTAFRDGHSTVGDYAGKYNLAPGWQKVCLADTPTPADDKEKSNAFILHLGIYPAEHLYISNLHIKKEVATPEEADVENTTTGIENVIATPVATGVYNLQGIRVADDINAELPAGLYISGGKKYIKR